MLLLSAAHRQWERWQLWGAMSAPLHDDSGPTRTLKNTVEEQKIVSVFFLPTHPEMVHGSAWDEGAETQSCLISCIIMS